MTSGTGRRVVIISPHLDDAAVSLAATVGHLARSGRDVVVVTVFAGDVTSTRPAGAWDSRARFRTEGEAARERRNEDAAALRLLGAAPIWLSFPDEDYAENRSEDEVWEAVSATLRDEDAVLVPGFPLTHRDHRWVAALVASRAPADTRLGFYAEQPYRYWTRRSRPRPEFAELAPAGVRHGPSARPGLDPRPLVRKWRVVRAYRSQLAALGLTRVRLARLLAHEALHGGEVIAWPEA